MTKLPEGLGVEWFGPGWRMSKCGLGSIIQEETQTKSLGGPISLLKKVGFILKAVESHWSILYTRGEVTLIRCYSIISLF